MSADTALKHVVNLCCRSKKIFLLSVIKEPEMRRSSLPPNMNRIVKVNRLASGASSQFFGNANWNARGRKLVSSATLFFSLSSFPKEFEVTECIGQRKYAQSVHFV